MNNEFEVITVVSSSVYTVTHSSAASGSTSGGGGSGNAKYQINVGPSTSTYGYGWGTLTWNLSTWKYTKIFFKRCSRCKKLVFR